MTIKRMLTAGTVAAVSDVHLQALLDKQACAEVMMTYCRAIDHRDEQLLRSVFHHDSMHRHGFQGRSSDASKPYQKGNPVDFVGYALDVLATFTHTHHQLGNIFIEPEADGVTAFTEAYFTAFHRMRANGDPLAAANAYDTQMDYWVGGRYMDRMQKRNGIWKIASRIGMTDWTRVDAPTSQGYFATPADLRSQQSRKDTLFHREKMLSNEAMTQKANA